MNESVIEILEKPAPVKAGILLGASALIAALYFFVFYSPVADEMAQLEEEVEKVNTEITQKAHIAKDLRRYEAEVEKLDADLRRALAELPDKREISQLLAKISDRAKDAGLEIALFKPRTEEKRELFAAVPVEIEVRGTYHQLATFFDEVGHLERIVNLGDYSLSNPVVSKTKVELTTSLVATAFRFLEESERPKSDDNKAGGKRRGAKSSSVDE